MKTITLAQLTDKLRAIRGARPITITALTDARARKTGNPYAEVLKLARVNGIVNVDYSAAVERQQARDEQPVGFAARPHAWGDRVDETPLRAHRETGKLYLTIKPQRVVDKPVYFGRNPTSGALVSVPKATVEPFLPAKRSNAAAQGVEHEVFSRDYALSGIVSAVIDGETYRIRAERAAG